MNEDDEISESEKHSIRSTLTLIMAILSGIGSFGSLILNGLINSELIGLGLLWFQGFAALTMILAVIFMIIEWDLRRDKWPALEQRYAQIDIISSIADPKYTPDSLHRLRIESLKMRKRLALAQDKKDLARQYQSEISEVRKHLKE